jgi:hypothetical protein
MLTTPPASPVSAAPLLSLLAVAKLLLEVVQLSWVPSSALHSVRAPLCPIAMASPSPENVIQVTRLCSDVASDVASRKQCRWSISTPPNGAMLCVCSVVFQRSVTNAHQYASSVMSRVYISTQAA